MGIKRKKRNCSDICQKMKQWGKISFDFLYSSQPVGLKVNLTPAVAGT